MHRSRFQSVSISVPFLVICLYLSLVQSHADPYIIRFSDTTSSAMSAPQFPPPQPANFSPALASTTQVSARAWLERHDWQKVWPRLGLSKAQTLFFDGPPNARYLRVDSEDTFYIWSHKLQVDPHERPMFEITWGMDRFPERAALDVQGRSDRPLVVMVSFGPEVPSGGLLPDVPRALAFFWGETETVGMNYTCIGSRHDATKKLQCKYPHVKYIALRSGGVGTLHTDQVHLVEAFQRYFPDYWKTHRRVPPIVAVSFEAHTRHTESLSQARLYTIAFTEETRRSSP